MNSIDDRIRIAILRIFYKAINGEFWMSLDEIEKLLCRRRSTYSVVVADELTYSPRLKPGDSGIWRHAILDGLAVSIRTGRCPAQLKD